MSSDIAIFSRCIFAGFNSNGGKNLLIILHLTFNIYNLLGTGVTKSVFGEITDHTNRADAFAMYHIPWTIGSSFGYGKHMFLEIELVHNCFSPNLQCTNWRVAFPAS